MNPGHLEKKNTAIKKKDKNVYIHHHHVMINTLKRIYHTFPASWFRKKREMSSAPLFRKRALKTAPCEVTQLKTSILNGGCEEVFLVTNEEWLL